LPAVVAVAVLEMSGQVRQVEQVVVEQVDYANLLLNL
jgi:hypothetical protein